MIDLFKKTHNSNSCNNIDALQFNCLFKGNEYKPNT